MHITPTTAQTPHHAPEPPRPALQEAQVSSRPVVAPTQNEATAQETRRNDERRMQRDAERQDAAQNKQSGSKTAAESAARRNTDPAIGSSVDVFA